MVFLTPHIVHGANDLAGIYKAKLAERDDYMEKIYGSDFRESDFYKQLPRPDDGVYRASPIDEAEERIREKNKADVYKAIGYDGLSDVNSADEMAPISSGSSETEMTVPFAPVGGGSGGGDSSYAAPVAEPVDSYSGGAGDSGDLPPPPENDDE